MFDFSDSLPQQGSAREYSVTGGHAVGEFGHLVLKLPAKQKWCKKRANFTECIKNEDQCKKRLIFTPNVPSPSIDMAESDQDRLGCHTYPRILD